MASERDSGVGILVCCILSIHLFSTWPTRRSETTKNLCCPAVRGLWEAAQQLCAGLASQKVTIWGFSPVMVIKEEGKWGSKPLDNRENSTTGFTPDQGLSELRGSQNPMVYSHPQWPSLEGYTHFQTSPFRGVGSWQFCALKKLVGEFGSSWVGPKAELKLQAIRLR